MKGFWPLLILLAVVGCSDSRTKSLEQQEADSLKAQVARLKEENAALHDRANTLSLDLEYQKSLNKELQAKLKAAPAAKEFERVAPEVAARPKPAAPEALPPVGRTVTEPQPAPRPPVAPAPEHVTPAAPSKAEGPTPSASKPRSLPDIRPKTMATKTEPAPEQLPAETLVEKPAPSAPPIQKPAPPTPPVAKAEPVRPQPQEDPYAAFKRPGFKEPAPAPDVEGTTAPDKLIRANPVEPQEQAAEAPKAPAPKDSAPRLSGPPSDLQLVDISESRAGSSVHITGLVANNTNKGILNVRVRAEFLDPDGGLISSQEYSVAAGTRLEAGERASFEVTSPQNPRISRYRLTALADQSR